MLLTLLCNFVAHGLQEIKCKTLLNKHKPFPTLVIHINMFIKKTFTVISDRMAVKIICSRVKHIKPGKSISDPD